jgi:hypothetical protein
MECHKCEWNERGPSPEKEVACWSCPQPCDAPPHRGRSFVHLDAGGSRQAAAEAAASNAPRPGGALDSVMPRCCQETAARILGFLSDLSDADRNLFMRVLAGQTFVEAARELGVTKQAVAARWRRAVRNHPEVAGFRTPAGRRP